ncbi:ribonuclease T2 family protein [Gluconobacter morbifer]|uniref:Ribonuclease I n=1 Tax=Gluconobacter morbifer G707 TaxID=1088869 RepID=G6XGW3_9PROT|nr:ribonuclease I [Gluconobacter morbifer]EHH69421.1 ribonuclease I [Gluconobacter morbifer G707]
MMRLALLGLCGVLAGCAGPSPRGPTLTPTAHTDFAHDTLALTWQPGFCATGSGCLPDQPHNLSIGLHGLWASEPHALEAKNIPVQTWWRQGCDLYDHDDQPPVLQSVTQAGIAAVMPHLKSPLHVHEYTKHARCFGYPADRFFVTSMQLRSRLAASGFGLWLAQQAGFQVRREDILSTFAQMTGATQPRALQLRCEPDAATKQPVLTQLWFTLDPARLNSFPAGTSYLPSPDDQNGCPASFLVPGWPLQAVVGTQAVQRP